MRKQRVEIRVFLAVTLLYGVPGQAQDHVVSSPQVSARLANATAERQADLAIAAALLSSPTASRTASLFGVDAEQMKGRLAHLSDGEARDLAARARALDVDPAGAASWKALWLTVIIAVGSWLALYVLFHYGGG